MKDNPTIYRKRLKLTHTFLQSGVVIPAFKKDVIALNKVRESKSIVARAKAEFAKEKAEREKLKQAIANKPKGVKMTHSKEGVYFYQPRDEKGRILPRVILAQ